MPLVSLLLRSQHCLGGRELSDPRRCRRTLDGRTQRPGREAQRGGLRNEAPNAAHYLVLDACRNTLQGARGGKGFVPVGQQSGVLIAFATEPGKTATDLGQRGGPYATALAAELVKPDQNDLLMFHRV